MLHAIRRAPISHILLVLALLVLWPITRAITQEPAAAKPVWRYDPLLLQPFWEGDTIYGESVLFIKDEKTGTARASVLFPVQKMLTVTNAVGDVTYEEGRDYTWKPDSREIILPADSRIVSKTAAELRRPAGTQKYKLTHRDGNGEIFFASGLEYQAMQTSLTYTHAPGLWKAPVPKLDPPALPRSIGQLVSREPLSIVLIGDSISTGLNSSGTGDGPPHQPGYPELLRDHLAKRYRGVVTLKNLAIGGTSTPSGVEMVDQAVEAQPHLVVIAFGMNDSSGRPAEEYQKHIQEMITRIREKLPECEFILVASMLGNPDWVALKQELFPAYRDALKELCGPGIVLADLTSTWQEFLKLKQDWDQTGNGVNHPNDFGHRVYAQTLITLLDAKGEPTAHPLPTQTIKSGPLTLIEERLLGNHTYSYACVASDLDGDGDLDLTSSDAEPNSNLYLLRNDGKGKFTHSFIQKYAGQEIQPIRLERHAHGDLDGDKDLDVVIVDNLKGDYRWFENPGAEALTQQWKLHRVSAPNEVPGAYDVALADLDGDGDLDVAGSSWVGGKRFDWYENPGKPGEAEHWKRYNVEDAVGETRTIAIADFNQDGKPDLLGTARTTNLVVWYANSGKPAEEPWTKTTIDGTTKAPAHGHPVDMDGDGDQDVLMAYGIVAPVGLDSPESHHVAWYENVGKPGKGTEWKKRDIGRLPQGFEAVAGDLDGDGDLDVVATGWSVAGRIVWFENTGDPNAEWKPYEIKTGWPHAVTVILADFDKDGRLDIAACAERGANEVRWWRNVGGEKK